ncbi:hypothetical protein MKX03_021739 [Papaver bracteatum]|nr:hypothetical protein MKX03_021739 [Papaver bracteatum]
MVSTFSAILFFLVLLFSTQSLSSSAHEGAAPSMPPSPEKVSLSLYYETFMGQKSFFFFNTVEVCAVHVWPVLRAWMIAEHWFGQHSGLICAIFTYGTNNYISKGEPSGWGSCLRRMLLQGKPIMDFYFSGLGKKVILICCSIGFNLN